jgi:uncharacterized protein YdeI (YjbR/CyaY-like superfamily)
MSTVITRERLSFWLNDKEYVEIDIPDDLQQAVDAILEFTESYETPDGCNQQARMTPTTREIASDSKARSMNR